MAPDQALTLANSLLSGNGSISQVNTLQAQINRMAGQASFTAANAQYGKQIAKDRAEVAKQSHLQAEMVALLRKIADKIGARPTAAEIRTELLALKRVLGGNLGIA